MTNQTETIVWHKYPEEKPPYFWASGLLVAIYNKPKGYVDVQIAEWNDDGFNTKHFNTYESVIAWAEMPKGWKE